jgi:hypothetical protein
MVVVITSWARETPLKLGGLPWRLSISRRSPMSRRTPSSIERASMRTDPESSGCQCADEQFLVREIPRGLAVMRYGRHRPMLIRKENLVVRPALCDRRMRNDTVWAESRGGFLVLIGYADYSITHQEHKKSANLHQAADTPWRFFVRKIALRTSTLVGQGTLPSPTAGCRIRFSESLLMLSRKKLASSDGLSRKWDERMISGRDVSRKRRPRAWLPRVCVSCALCSTTCCASLSKRFLESLRARVHG